MQDALLNQQEYQLMDVCAPNADRFVYQTFQNLWLLLTPWFAFL